MNKRIRKKRYLNGRMWYKYVIHNLSSSLPEWHDYVDMSINILLGTGIRISKSNIKRAFKYYNQL